MATIDALRDLVWSKTNGICELCGQPVDRQDMHMDHIKPVWQGGPHTLDNLRPTHRLCNMKRSESHRRGADHPNWKGGIAGVFARLPNDLREELQQIADSEHRTLTNLIIHALREWLEARAKESRRSLNSEIVFRLEQSREVEERRKR